MEAWQKVKILVYCDKHKGYQNCNCNEIAKHSKQTNIQLVDSKNEDECNSASKVPQFVAAIVGMCPERINIINCKIMNNEPPQHHNSSSAGKYNPWVMGCVCYLGTKL